jgi:hypothetical protein
VIAAIVAVSCGRREAALDSSGGAEPPSCEGFSRRYLGQELRAALPEEAPATLGESTADIGPVYAGCAVQLELTNGSIMIGRRAGTTIVPAPSFSQRVDGDAVVFVKSENEPLRTCILESAAYDRRLDEKDG